MSVFRSLQDSAFTNWFLGSDSIWTYPTVLTLHTVGLAMLVGASVVVDLRVLKVGAEIPLARLRPLFRVMAVGFTINLLTGLVLFISKAADLVVTPIFYVKLASICGALWLGLRLKRRIVERAAPSLGDIGAGRQMAAASLLLWTFAIVTGRLVAYFAP